jgi:hypothetical protein
MARVIVHANVGRNVVAVRLPKGDRTLTPRLVSAIDAMDQRVSTSKGCVVAFFRKRGGGLKAVQRCEGRSLSRQAKSRWNKIKGKKVCRGRTGKAKGKFTRCR